MPGPLCTRAVTGPAFPAHQPIYICRTCRLADESGDGSDDGEALPPCVCESCAFACHEGHDVVFLGVGPCSCDCPVLEGGDEGGCLLAAASRREAERLGFGSPRPLNCPLDDGSGAAVGDVAPGALGKYVCESLTLPALAEDEGDLCRRLIRQAEVLAGRSKETFWVPDDAGVDDEGLCDLEVLAREVCRRHVLAYALRAPGGVAPANAPAAGGAEWWVQVKPAGPSRAPVDLHYDKDEALAESFGLGSFPTLSTVTYLTEGEDNMPTLMFPHTYFDDEEEEIRGVALSHARRGKVRRPEKVNACVIVLDIMFLILTTSM